jgi:hypothetical protein
MTEFVIDTVGEVETPGGDRFRGVILALPVGLTPEQEAEALREIARLWAERVTLAPVQREDAA